MCANWRLWGSLVLRLLLPPSKNGARLSVPTPRLTTFPYPNAACYLFFAVPESEELDDACSTLVRQLATVKSPSLNPTWSSARHISLSRTVVLRMHQIDGFIARLKHHVRNTAPFQVEFDGLQQYCNEDRSKGFLGWVRTPGVQACCGIHEYMSACTYVFTHNLSCTLLARPSRPSTLSTGNL